METSIIICEKPDSCARIANALAEGRLKTKKSKYGVSYYEFERNGKKHVAVSAVGHLFNLKQKGKNYPMFDADWVPSFQATKKSLFSKRYFMTIEEVAKTFKGDLISATDYDNEGCVTSFEKIIIKENGVTKIVNAGDYIESKFMNKSSKKWKDFDYIDVENEDIFIPAFSKNASDIDFTKVKRLIKRNGDKTILRIKTENGRSIHVSKGHPCFVLTSSGLMIKHAEHLQIGDYLPIAKALPFNEPKVTQLDMIEQLRNNEKVYVYGFNKVIDLMPSQMAKKLGVDRKLCLNWRFWDRIPLWAYLKLESKNADRKYLKIGFTKAKKKIPVIIEFNRDFGRLLGYYLAEGCIDTGGFIGFYFGPTEDDFVSDIKTILKNIFGIENIKYRKRAVKAAYGNSITPEIGTKSRILEYIIDKILMLGKCSYDKKVPPFILSTPIEFIEGLIDGYLAGDGSSFKDKKGRLIVSAGSKSRNMIEGLHLVLLKLGINSSLIYDKNRNIWFLIIGSFREIKKLQINNILRVFEKSSLEKALEKECPYMDRDSLAVFPNFILKGCSVNAFTEHNMNYSKRTSQQSLLTTTPFISKLLAGNLHFLRVKKLDELPYEGPLYDVETETSSFMHGNGIITHNSVIAANIIRFIFKKEDAKRMKFSTLARQDLIKSYEDMSSHLDWGNIESGITRHYMDWMYGLNTSKALMLSIKNYSKRFAILSAGRVQAPTLVILANREMEIRNFVPKPYWQLQMILSINDIEIIALYEKDKIWNKEEAEKIFNNCKNKEAIVDDVNKKKYEQAPPFPFNITSLQTEAYRFFGYSPQQTLRIAQSLYEMALVSYPRSSSEKIPKQLGYREILKALSKIKKYEPFCKKLLSLAELKPNEGRREDAAHYAIIPTQEVSENINKLSKLQQNLYDLICRRFFSVFVEHAVREVIRIIFDVNGYNFLAEGRRTLEKGWMEFYGSYAKFDETSLPDLEKGDKIDTKKLEVLDKKTSPPPRFSQASIIKEMEKRNLGTRATRSTILQTLYDRNYIADRNIQVNDLGLKMACVIKNYVPDFADEKLTRKFEKDLDEIMQGKKKKEEILNKAKKAVVKICEEFKQNEEKIGKELGEAITQMQNDKSIIGKCPKCGNDLKILYSPKTRKYFVGCSGYKDGCRTAYPLIPKSSFQKTDKICDKCKTPIIKVFRRGRRFNMCLDPNCETKADWKKSKMQE